MGRNAVNTDLHKGHLTKEQIEFRKERENALFVGDDKVRPPKWLDDVAKKEFRRVVKEFKKIKLISNLDVSMLSMYCDLYSKYQECTKQINENGLTVEYKNKNGDVNESPSPYAKLQLQYVDKINKIASSFGLTVSSRMKLTLPKEEKEDEFGTQFD